MTMASALVQGTHRPLHKAFCTTLYAPAVLKSIFFLCYTERCCGGFLQKDPQAGPFEGAELESALKKQLVHFEAHGSEVDRDGAQPKCMPCVPACP